MLKAVIAVRENDMPASTAASRHKVPSRTLRRYVLESMNEPRSTFFYYRHVSEVRARLDGFQLLPIDTATPTPTPTTLYTLTPTSTTPPPKKSNKDTRQLLLEGMVDMVGRTDSDGTVWLPLWYVDFLIKS